MAKSDSGNDQTNLMNGESFQPLEENVLGPDLSKRLNLDFYNRKELYSGPEAVSGNSDLYIMDAEASHSENAIQEFAELFKQGDLLVPSSNYSDVAYFIPFGTGFKADEHVETSWGYVQGERDKYFLISDS